MKLERQATKFGWTIFPYVVSGMVFWKLIEPITPSNVLDHGFQLTVAGTIRICYSWRRIMTSQCMPVSPSPTFTSRLQPVMR